MAAHASTLEHANATAAELDKLAVDLTAAACRQAAGDDK
jgi:hypothetical protein